MKRWLAGLLALTLMLTLVSCTPPMSADEKAYNKAVEAYDDKDYEAAIEAFEELGDYKDSQDYLKKSYYKQGQKLMKAEKYAEAIPYFEKTGDYKESKDLLATCREKAGVQPTDPVSPTGTDPGNIPDDVNKMNLPQLVYTYAKKEGESLGNGSYRYTLDMDGMLLTLEGDGKTFLYHVEEGEAGNFMSVDLGKDATGYYLQVQLYSPEVGDPFQAFARFDAATVTGTSFGDVTDGTCYSIDADGKVTSTENTWNTFKDSLLGEIFFLDFIKEEIQDLHGMATEELGYTGTVADMGFPKLKLEEGPEPWTDPEPTEPETEPVKDLNTMTFHALVCELARRKGTLVSSTDLYDYETTNVYGEHSLAAYGDGDYYFNYEVTTSVESPDSYRDAEITLEYWLGDYVYTLYFDAGEKHYKAQVTFSGEDWMKTLTCRDLSQLPGTFKELDEYGWEKTGTDVWEMAIHYYGMEILDGLQRAIVYLNDLMSGMGYTGSLSKMGFPKLDPSADWGDIGQQGPVAEEDIFSFYYELAVQGGYTDDYGNPYFSFGTDDFLLSVYARDDSYVFVWDEYQGSDTKLTTTLRARKGGLYTFNMFVVMPALELYWEGEASFDPEECTGTSPKQFTDGRAWMLDKDGNRTGEISWNDFILEMEREYLTLLRETCKGDAFLAEYEEYKEEVTLEDIGFPNMYYEPEEDTLSAWLFYVAVNDNDAYYDYDYDDWNVEYEWDEDNGYWLYATQTGFTLELYEDSANRYMLKELIYNEQYGYFVELYLIDYNNNYGRSAEFLIDPATFSSTDLTGISGAECVVLDMDGNRVSNDNVWSQFVIESEVLLKDTLNDLFSLAYSLVDYVGGPTWAEMGFLQLN